MSEFDWVKNEKVLPDDPDSWSVRGRDDVVICRIVGDGKASIVSMARRSSRIEDALPGEIVLSVGGGWRRWTSSAVSFWPQVKMATGWASPRLPDSMLTQRQREHNVSRPQDGRYGYYWFASFSDAERWVVDQLGPAGEAPDQESVGPVERTPVAQPKRARGPLIDLVARMFGL